MRSRGALPRSTALRRVAQASPRRRAHRPLRRCAAVTATLGARFEASERRLVMEFPADFPWRRRLGPMLERGDDGRLLVETSAEWRRKITERDPLLFALIYLRKHVTVKRYDPERGEHYEIGRAHV